MHIFSFSFGPPQFVFTFLCRRVSTHFQTKEPMPDELINAIISSKNACIGLKKLRQLFMGIFDVYLHTSAPLNEESPPEEISQIWDKMKKDISLIPSTPDTNYVACWMHLCAGSGCLNSSKNRKECKQLEIAHLFAQ